MTQPTNVFIQNQWLGRGVNIIGYDPIWKSRGEARIVCDINNDCWVEPILDALIPKNN